MAELEWVAGKVGSWFTAADWSPEEVPTASDEVIIDGTSSLAEIDDATGVANTVTIDADDELEVGTGGVLDATNTINVDGVGAELLVTNGGKVESFNFNVLDIGGTTPNSAGEGELTLAGTGAAIEPATVELNGGSSALDFEMTVAEYTFSNNITGLGHVVEVGPGNVILTGDNTYSGGTFIEDATLQIGNGGATGSIGSGKVIDDGTLAFDQLGSHVIANAISGPGGVSFSGGGVFALTGDDSYSGVTTIAAGTKLTFAFLGTGGIVDNGSLSFEFSGAVSLTNNISGSGEVFQNGSTLTLTGDNTYTGATTVESGTLKAGASDAFSAASAFDVFSGSTLDLNGFNNTIGGLSGAGTVNNSSSADKAGLGVGESVNSTFSGVIENTGAALTLLVAGAGTLTLTGANTYTGDTIIVNGCTLQIGNGGTTGTLGRGEVVDSGTLVFDYDQSVKELISQDISDGKLGPGSLTVEGGGAVVLLGDNTYSGVTTISSGDLIVGQSLQPSGTLGTGKVVDNDILSFARPDTTTVTNAISGTGQVFQAFGTTIFTGDNTYSGATTVESGTLQAGGRSAFSANSAVTVDAGATLDINGFSNSIGGLSGAGTVDNSASFLQGLFGVLQVDEKVDSTFSGVIENSSSDLDLNVSGGGTLTLTGANTYTGETFIQGTLQIGDGGATGTLGSGQVNDSGLLIFDRSNNETISQTISDSPGFGSGSLTIEGGGVVTLLDDDTYSGVTTISSGELEIGDDTTDGALGTGAVDDNAVLAFARKDTITVANAISGTGSVLARFGTTIMTGANNYTGGSVVDSGATLEVLNASTTSAVGVLGLGGVVLEASGLLVFDNDDMTDGGYVVNEAISGFGGVKFQGGADSVTTLNDASGFTGGAVISSGIVDLGNNAALGSGLVTMTGGAIRADNGAKTLANSFSLSGTIGLGATTNISGAITLKGATIVTPSETAGASTWSGKVFLGAFTLATGNSGPNTHGGSWSGQALTISGAISGTGGVTQASSGELILSGANAYSGLTTVTSGALEVLNASTTSAVGVLGSGNVAVQAGATLLFDNADTIDNGYVVKNVISSEGEVNFAGANDSVTTLNVANSFDGAHIFSGIVDLGNNASLGAGPVAMTGGAIRADNGAKTIANKFTLSGTIGLGAATNISGAITLAGATVVTPSENAGNSTWSGAVSLGAFTLATGNTGPNTHNGSWSGQALTISGVISGTGGVTQDSSGELILSGAKTYSGPTTVTSGKLEVLNSSTTSAVGVLGGGQVNVATGAALLFDNADTVDNGYVVNNVISGAGAVDFVGSNGAVTTLNVANSFTGGANISSGIVDLSNNASLGSGLVTMTGGAIRADHGAKTLANKFTLSGTIGLGAGTSISGAITLAGNTIVTPSENAGNSTWSGAVSLGAFTLATGNTGPNTHGGSWSGQALTISGAISETGGVTQASSGELILSGRNTYSGPTTVASGALEVLNASTTSAIGVLGSGNVVVDAGAVLLFDNADTIDNGYVVNNLISGEGEVNFAGANGGVTTLNVANSFDGAHIFSGIVDLSNNASLGVGPVTMTGGAIRADHGAKTLANKFTLSGTIGLGAATSISGAITLAGNTIVTPSENAGNSTWSGAISLGAFTLATGNTGPNTHSGSWSGQALTISGAISGTGGITQGSSGTLILSGGNTYSGPTTVASGTLEVLNASTTTAVGVLGSGSVVIDSGATVLFANHDTVNDGYLVKNSISGAGSLVFAGQTDSVTTMFNNEPLFTGSTTISNGIVNVWENDDVFGSGEVTMTGGALRATELPATIANNFRLSGTIGLGGSTNISGAITLAGNTTVTPSENAGDSTWSGAVSLGGFTLATGDSGPNSDGGSWSGQALTISGAISGTGGVTQDSLGELDLTGRNSYSGATTIEEGALAIGNAQALGSGGLRFSGSGALDADFTGTVTTATTVNAGVAASITAGAGDSFTLSGALTQAAGSTLTLGGGVTLTLTGASTVSNLTVRGNAVVVNDATTTQSGGSVTLNTAVPTAVTELFNEATWQITDNSGIAISDDTVSLFDDSISFIDNADFLLKSGGTGTSKIALTVTNTGEIVAASGTFDFQQAVTGTGTDLISGASTLEFDATVAGSQAVEFSGSSGILDLTAPQSFAATISGFNEGAPGGTNDAIQLLGNWSETGFSENSGNTQATLTLSNGTTSASLIFAGVYNQSQFTLSQSGGVLTTIV